jgi:hypothetical protein
LPQRFDLPQRDLGERHGPFVFVEQSDHKLFFPQPGNVAQAVA